jgi:hypothetical protein
VGLERTDRLTDTTELTVAKQCPHFSNSVVSFSGIKYVMLNVKLSQCSPGRRMIGVHAFLTSALHAGDKWSVSWADIRAVGPALYQEAGWTTVWRFLRRQRSLSHNQIAMPTAKNCKSGNARNSLSWNYILHEAWINIGSHSVTLNCITFDYQRKTMTMGQREDELICVADGIIMCASLTVENKWTHCCTCKIWFYHCCGELILLVVLFMTNNNNNNNNSNNNK